MRIFFVQLFIDAYFYAGTVVGWVWMWQARNKVPVDWVGAYVSLFGFICFFLVSVWFTLETIREAVHMWRRRKHG